MREHQRPIAVSIGDPSGIGPEIALAAWTLRDRHGLSPFYLIGDPALLANRAKSVRLDVPLRETDPNRAASIFDQALPVVPLGHSFSNTPGEPSSANAPGIVAAIDRAVMDVLGGDAGAVVTLPIAKKVLYGAGFAFPGHTEYLAHLAERHSGRPTMPVMMLAGPDLRTVPVTIHIPFNAVPQALNPDLLDRTIAITANELSGRFGIARPRIAVAGLNPHAGEGGTIGSEDAELIEPAIRRAQAAGIDAFGPLPADTMFHARARQTYDVAICMYHDQALIPAKALAFDEAVNVTLGLPFIRTSPDHGTAFDIAGRGIARPDSFIAALKLASRLDVNSR